MLTRARLYTKRCFIEPSLNKSNVDVTVLIIFDIIFTVVIER